MKKTSEIIREYLRDSELSASTGRTIDTLESRLASHARKLERLLDAKNTKPIVEITCQKSNGEKYHFGEISDLILFSGCHKQWVEAESKFEDSRRTNSDYEELDRARGAFLKQYNQQFKAKLRPSYDFHLIDELSASELASCVKFQRN